MVHTRSTPNSESKQRETNIVENLHQCFSVPTESFSEEEQEATSEQKLLELLNCLKVLKMTTTYDINVHIDYLNSSIDELEYVERLLETVNEIKREAAETLNRSVAINHSGWSIRTDHFFSQTKLS